MAPGRLAEKRRHRAPLVAGERIAFDLCFSTGARRNTPVFSGQKARANDGTRLGRDWVAWRTAGGKAEV